MPKFLPIVGLERTNTEAIGFMVQIEYADATSEPRMMRVGAEDRAKAPLSPELKSWVDNCLVPVLIKVFLEEFDSQDQLALEIENMKDCTSGITSPRRAKE
jgi:hypothetical protein